MNISYIIMLDTVLKAFLQGTCCIFTHKSHKHQILATIFVFLVHNAHNS